LNGHRAEWGIETKHFFRSWLAPLRLNGHRAEWGIETLRIEPPPIPLPCLNGHRAEWGIETLDEQDDEDDDDPAWMVIAPNEALKHLVMWSVSQEAPAWMVIAPNEALKPSLCWAARTTPELEWSSRRMRHWNRAFSGNARQSPVAWMVIAPNEALKRRSARAREENGLGLNGHRAEWGIETKHFFRCRTHCL
jgi:hypothetical protein